MRTKAFDRSEHVYKNDAFAELVKDAVRFFNGTWGEAMRQIGNAVSVLLGETIGRELASRLGARSGSAEVRQAYRARL